MKKIFCKNCKFSFGWIDEDFCKPVKDRFTMVKSYSERNSLNSYGECIHYVRKWWKFWINDYKEQK